MKFQTKVALVFSILITLVFAGTGAYLYPTASDHVRNDMGYELQGIAAAAALDFDGPALGAAIAGRDMKSPAYQALKLKLAKISRATRLLKVEGVVVMRRTDTPNHWEYLVDADESEDAYTLGFPFDATNWPELRAAYNGPTHDADYRSDEYGTYLSGYAPIYDARGKAAAVLEVWAGKDSVQRLQDAMVRGVLTALALGLLLSLPCSFLLGRMLAEPVRVLTDAVRRVGAGDLTQKVELGGAAEFEGLATAFNEMVAGLRERDFVKGAFEKYVSKEVAAKIMSLPLDQVLAGERRRVSVLFTDVRRFTEMSEKLQPEEVLSALNDHFSMLIDVLFEYEGTLDKFLGDGLMAIFGAPITHGNDAERAVRAALQMQERIREHNARQKAAGKPPLEIGIGVNTGTAVAGNIGSAKRKEYSVIGDTVNTAARLQAIAPAGDVLISRATYDELKSILEAEPLPPQTLKGKAGAIEVFRAVRFTVAR